MKFYHGTSKENWKNIQEEGILWGKRGMFNGREIDRCTYLATDIEEAKQYGDIVLEVEYEPKENSLDNNYFDDTCWQIRVYVPIDIKNIKLVYDNKTIL